MSRIDMNGYVKVKLNKEGDRILKESHDRLYYGISIKREYKAISKDKDGYSKFQLWELMSQFGEHISMGCIPPFDTEIIVGDEAK